MKNIFKKLMLFCACCSTQLVYGAGAGAQQHPQLPAQAKPAASALHVLATMATALAGGATPNAIAHDNGAHAAMCATHNPAPSPTSQLFPSQALANNVSPVKPVAVYTHNGGSCYKNLADLFPGQAQ